MKKKIIIGSIIAITVIAFATIGIYNTKSTTTANKQNKKSVAVHIEEIKSTNITSYVTTTGTIDSGTKESIYANASLKVDKILANPGDIVKKDDVLIAYDQKSKEDLEKQLEKAKLSLDIEQLNLEAILPKKSDLNARSKELENTNLSLKRSLEKKTTSYNDSKKLFDAGDLTKETLDDISDEIKTLTESIELNEIQLADIKEEQYIASQSLESLLTSGIDSKLSNQINIAQKQIQLQQLQVDSIEEELSNYITGTQSTTNGTVLSINAEEGTIINSDLPVAVIGDLNDLIIKIEVSEFDSPALKLNQKINITGDAFSGITYEGNIINISPVATKKNTSTGLINIVNVEAKVTSSDSLLKPGYSVDIDIITNEKENALVVPILSLLKDKDGNNYIFIVKDDNSLEKRKITPLIYSDLYVEVSDIKEGEKVVINPTAKLDEGTFVNPINNDENDKGDKS